MMLGHRIGIGCDFRSKVRVQSFFLYRSTSFAFPRVCWPTAASKEGTAREVLLREAKRFLAH